MPRHGSPSDLLQLVFTLYWAIVVARAVLSWVRIRRGTILGDKIAPLVYALTEPLLAPIRRALRQYQGSMPLDLSPLLLMALLGVVEALVVRVLRTAGL